VHQHALLLRQQRKAFLGVNPAIYRYFQLAWSLLMGRCWVASFSDTHPFLSSFLLNSYLSFLLGEYHACISLPCTRRICANAIVTWPLFVQSWLGDVVHIGATSQ
jgi:hypothetical protein